MKTAIRRVLRNVWRQIPGKGVAARAVALAPPALKGPLACRVLSRLIDADDLRRLGTIETNLGLATPSVRISGRAIPQYFFGTPEHYPGERGALTLARCLSPRCDSFIDVGANYGYFVYYMGTALAGAMPLHYLEPVPALFDEIEANVRRLQLRDVHGHRLAISGKTGETKFYLNLSDTQSSSLTREFGALHQLEETVVQASTFDDFIETKSFRHACVKVDIENAERAFLEGIQRHHDRIEFLIIEVLGPAYRAGFINKARAQLGMNAYYIDDLTLRLSLDGSFEYHAPDYNWLFCRLSPKELRPLLAGTPLQVA
jgi:FkbM family methyltransferase